MIEIKPGDYIEYDPNKYRAGADTPEDEEKEEDEGDEETPTYQFPFRMPTELYVVIGIKDSVVYMMDSGGHPTFSYCEFEPPEIDPHIICTTYQKEDVRNDYTIIDVTEQVKKIELYDIYMKDGKKIRVHSATKYVYEDFELVQPIYYMYYITRYNIYRKVGDNCYGELKESNVELSSEMLLEIEERA